MLNSEGASPSSSSNSYYSFYKHAQREAARAFGLVGSTIALLKDPCPCFTLVTFPGEAFQRRGLSAFPKRSRRSLSSCWQNLRLAKGSLPTLCSRRRFSSEGGFQRSQREAARAFCLVGRTFTLLKDPCPCYTPVSFPSEAFQRRGFRCSQREAAKTFVLPCGTARGPHTKRMHTSAIGVSRVQGYRRRNLKLYFYTYECNMFGSGAPPSPTLQC